jgi:outer membrane lipoprotein
MRRTLLVIIISFLASSCAHVISKDTLSKARTDVSFSAVAKDPFFYEGSLFVWGGVIVKTSLTNKGSVIEVRQSPLGRYGAPEDTDISEGRFLVRSKRHLDPLIYETGREMTVAGVLTGTARRQLGEIEYVYPVLEAREIFLWKEDIYYYYPPYYYDPWYYDSWYYDPWYRWPRHRYPYWHRH